MAGIDIVQVLDRISEATRNYIDDNSFSGSYNDLTDKPTDSITKSEVEEITTQATDMDVANMLTGIFNN